MTRLFTLAVVVLLAGRLAAAPPNVVVILADDIGYGDLGCYGATKVKTPNLDRLARQGLRFTDAHSPAAVCTPTRYSLMTGQYAFRHPPGSRILSGVAPLCIPADRKTVPQVFQAAGYKTGVVGKWHLGLGDKEPDYNALIKPGPREVGFDSSFVIPATGDRTPCVYVENGRVAGLDPNDPIRVSYTAKVGDEPTGRENPELLTVQKPSHGHDMTIVNGVSRIGWMAGGKAARWNDETMADDLTRKATAFVDANKAGPFFLYFATHGIHVPRVPHPRFRGTSGHGLRGDAIHELDWCVGELLAALDKHKLADNTLVVFTSDNGGVMDDGYQDGSGTDASGHQCNGPLRGFKGGPYEGGSRVPFIARWPGHVPAGKTSGELVCHVDLLATCAALTGQRLPAAAGPDSFDILPALLAEKPSKPCRDHLVTQAGNPALLSIRRGPMKLVPAVGKKGKGGPELYDLAADLAESNNLAADRPEVVKELAALLDKVRAEGRSRPAEDLTPKPTTAADRPNVLWIVVDDMSPNFGCYGETTIATPHVDRLAAEGTRFAKAFVTAPVCSPCRSALITGMYQTSIGAHHHRSGRGELKIRLPAGVAPIPVLFQKAGYHTCTTSWPPAKGVGKTDYNFEWDRAMYDGTDWAKRKPGQPFFAQVQLHGGKHRDGGGLREPVKHALGTLTDPAKVKLPPYYPNDPVIRQDWAAYLDAVRFTDGQVGEVLKRLADDKLLDTTVVFFLTDHGISHARGKQFLYDEGIHVPLVVRGPGLDPGKVRGDLVEHIDLTATSLALAGIAVPNLMRGRNVLGPDYQPRDAVFAARDRCDETVDHIRSVRTERFKYIRNGHPGRPHLQPNQYKDNKPTVRRLREMDAAGTLTGLPKALLLAPTRAKEELYDLRADPSETRNLAADPGFKTVLAELGGRLDRWTAATNDRGPESDAMYDSDMAVYLAGQGKGGDVLRRNIELNKRWAKEAK